MNWFLVMNSDLNCMSSYISKGKDVTVREQHWQFAEIFLSPCRLDTIHRETCEEENSPKG